MTVYPFNRFASYAHTQSVVDLAAPRSVGRLLDLEREKIIEQGIHEIVSAYHRRQIARADARAHVRGLLKEAKQVRADMLDARKRRYYAIRYFEENYLSAARDCWEAFRSRNRGV